MLKSNPDKLSLMAYLDSAKTEWLALGKVSEVKQFVS